MINLTKEQADAIDRLKAAGFKASWWGRPAIPERIYLNYRRDVKCYISFDDPKRVEGAALKIVIADCRQHSNWYKAERGKIAEWAAPAMAAVTGSLASELDDLSITTSNIIAQYCVGESVRFYTGGAAGEDNEEQVIEGVIKKLESGPASPGTIGDTEQTTVVVGDEGDDSNDCRLYTWRGLLRYGGGAQTVRTQSIEGQE